MRKLITLTIVFVAPALFAAPIWQASSASADSSKGRKIDAAALYQQQCAKCHGADGKGIESLPDIPNFTDAKWQSSRSDKQLAKVINDGKGIMPGFKDTLSAAEVQALVKHVRSFASGAGSKSKGKSKRKR